MGWINTLLTATTAVSTLSTAATLSQMQQDQAASANTQALLDSMRSQVFELKQLTGEALEEADSNRKIAAFHLRLLAYRVEKTWIAPDLFPQTADKEYTAEVYQTIRKQSARIFGQLSAGEQKEVKKAEGAFLKLADATTYLNHVGEAQAVRQAQDTLDELQGRNKTFMPITFVLLYALIGMVMLAMMFTKPSTNICTGGFIAVIGLAAFQMFFVRRGKYQAAKKLLEESALNMEKFAELEAKFDSIDAAQEQQMAAEAILAQFKANNPSADDLPELAPLKKPVNRTNAPSAESDRPGEQPAVEMVGFAEAQEEETYECTACGKQVSEDMRYCPYCGEKFE